MTDTRLPETWMHDRRILRLTDGAYRSFANALQWSVVNRTEGLIESADLSLIPSFRLGVEDELVASGLWIEISNGRWQISDFRKTQTGRSELEMLDNMRQMWREQKARKRAEKTRNMACPPDIPPDIPADVPADVSGGQDRIGQDRTGSYEPDLSPTEVKEPTGVKPSSSPGQLLPKPGTGTARARKRRTQVRDDYMPAETTIATIRAELPHVMSSQFQEQHRIFIDHWKKTGKPMADWDATWRNWMRTAAKRGDFGQPRINGYVIGTATQNAMTWDSMKDPEEINSVRELPQ